MKQDHLVMGERLPSRDGETLVQTERASPASQFARFDVPILIVSYARAQDVAACLRALARLAPKPTYEVFVAENAGPAAFEALVSELAGGSGPCVAASPADASLLCPIAVRQRRLKIEREGGTPETYVHLAKMPENLGYAGGVNAWLMPLLKVPGWRGAWILNPDTEPEPDALAALADYAATYAKGLVGSRLVFKTDRSRLQTRGLSWRRLRGTVVGVDKNAPASIEPDIVELERRLDAPSGASTYATRELIERIGLMREHYFLYFEDLDWGVRAKEHGQAVGYVHASIVLHQGGSTIGSAQVRGERSQLSVYLDTRNRLLFVKEHYPLWLPWSIAVGLADSVVYIAVGSIPNFMAAIKGLTAGVLGEAGRPRSFVRLTQPWRFEIPAKRRIKILISALYWIGQASWRALMRLIGTDRSLVIIYYHGVSSAQRENFARQLSSLAKRADVVPADFAGDGRARRHRVAITFDDGLTSVLENAIPELVKRQMPCTIFFPTGALGTVPDWETEAEHDSRDAVMDPQSVKDLPSALVTIGAHSVSHPHLTDIPAEQSRREIAGSKAALEELTGRQVSLFAFPYGDFDDESLKICRQEGLSQAYSVTPQVVNLRSKAILRGRISVGPADGPIEFYLKSSGAYAWVAGLAWLRQFIRARGL